MNNKFVRWNGYEFIERIEKREGSSMYINDYDTLIGRNRKKWEMNDVGR